MRNEDLVLMMHLEKTLVYFATALKGNSMVLEKISALSSLTLHEEEQDLLQDALIECRQAVDMAEIYLQIMGSIGETSASMISNNMNTVMKFLAGVTVILMVPTIVAGIFGMNIPLPFQEHPLSLPAIIGLTLLICLALWKLLSRKHWMD
jgi:magnesium transporter